MVHVVFFGDGARLYRSGNPFDYRLLMLRREMTVARGHGDRLVSSGLLNLFDRGRPLLAKSRRCAGWNARHNRQSWLPSNSAETMTACRICPWSPPEEIPGHPDVALSLFSIRFDCGDGVGVQVNRACRIILGLRQVDDSAAKIHLRPCAGVLFSQTHP